MMKVSNSVILNSAFKLVFYFPFLKSVAHHVGLVFPIIKFLQHFCHTGIEVVISPAQNGATFL